MSPAERRLTAIRITHGIGAVVRLLDPTTVIASLHERARDPVAAY
jgi:hypothetical protein